MIGKFMTLFSLINASYSQCIGDTNSDNIVDVNDVLNILSSYGQYNDVYSDSIVDVNDLLLVLSRFSETCETCVCCPAGAQCLVPDPVCCNEACEIGDNCGGQVWSDCGTSCPLVCGNAAPTMCNMMCNSVYQCPSNLWWDDTNKLCVVGNDCQDELPPGIAIGRPYIDKVVVQSCVTESNGDWYMTGL